MIRTASMIDPLPEPEAAGGEEGVAEVRSEPSPELEEVLPLRPAGEDGPEGAETPEDATEGQEGSGEAGDAPAEDQDGTAGD